MGRKIEKCIKALARFESRHKFHIDICIGAFHVGLGFVGGKKGRKGAERRIVTEGGRGRSVDTVKEDEIKLI